MTERTLLLVDGTNIVMRQAFGGDVAAQFAVPNALRFIERVAQSLCATHLIITLDAPDGRETSWRRQLYADYKAHRTTSTSEYAELAAAKVLAAGWALCTAPGYEADDLLATLTRRARENAGANVIVLTGDGDMLQLADRASVIRPTKGGFEVWDEARVAHHYEIPSAKSLQCWKALVGDPGDNVPGVPGIGPKKAGALVRSTGGDLEMIIADGERGFSAPSMVVARHADAARLAYQLVGLKEDAPVEPMNTSGCRFRLLPRDD